MNLDTCAILTPDEWKEKAERESEAGENGF